MKLFLDDVVPEGPALAKLVAGCTHGLSELVVNAADLRGSVPDPSTATKSFRPQLRLVKVPRATDPELLCSVPYKQGGRIARVEQILKIPTTGTIA